MRQGEIKISDMDKLLHLSWGSLEEMLGLASASLLSLLRKQIPD